MKNMISFLFLTLLLFMYYRLNAQVIPVFPVKPKTTETSTKSKKTVATTVRQKKPNIIPTIEMVYVGNFSIGRYEVTQAQWVAVMGSNPSYFKGDNLPVEQVSWDDIQVFLQKLNSLTGKNYRLPTEAEWAFAAKGGSQSHGYDYAGSNDANAVAWSNDNSGNATHPVGQKQPNELGIYDLSGNVEEWCSDWTDGSHIYRVYRGGSWCGPASYCRVAHSPSTPGGRGFYLGFRLVSPE